MYLVCGDSMYTRAVRWAARSPSFSLRPVPETESQMVDRKVRGDRGVGAGEEDGVVSDLTLISSRRAIKVTSSHQQQPGEHEYVSRNLSVPYPCTHHISGLQPRCIPIACVFKGDAMTVDYRLFLTSSTTPRESSGCTTCHYTRTSSYTQVII